MKKLLTSLLMLLQVGVANATTTVGVQQGGTGINTISGIPYGTGISPLSIVTIGSGLSFIGGTLSATGSILSSNNTWTGVNTFDNNFIIDGSGSGQTVSISDAGNSNGLGIFLGGNGATTPNKYIRIYDGAFQLLNSAYTSAIFQVDDAGNLTTTAAIAAPQVNVGNPLTQGYMVFFAAGSGYTTLQSINNTGSNYTIYLPIPTNSTDSLAFLGTQDQVLAGGANVTMYYLGSSSQTIDCGKSPLQLFENAGAATITAPIHDGSCVVEFMNITSASTITLTNFSGKSPGGATYSTANTASATVTFTNSSANITWTANGLTLGAPVYFSTTGGLPTNFTAGTVYYVVSTATNTITVSGSPGGSAVVAGSAGSGTQTGHEPSVFDLSITRIDGMSLGVWAQVQ